MGENYVYSTPSICGREISVSWDGRKCEVFVSGITHATSDEQYAGDVDGLSIAIYRAHYLAGTVNGRSARASMTEAENIIAMGLRAAHQAWINKNVEVV